MDNIILNLFAFISFILVIKYIWYPIMLSAFRDKMFSIRLSYRDYFYDNKLAMDTIAYKSTYDYINNTIRYVEDYSFLDMIYKLHLLSKHKDIIKEIQDNTKNELVELSQKDKEFVMNIRKEISEYLVFHILRTSFIAIFLTIFLTIYFIIVSVFRKPETISLSSDKLSYIVSN